MFFEALQSYCAPILTLFIFIVIILKDTLFEKRVRYLFLCESFVILLIIAATWADRCFSAMELGGLEWKLRTLTTYVNFSISPVSPLLLMLIYNNKNVRKQLIYFIPMLVNLILCTVSLFTGWIFNITSENIYSRGPLFFVPFLVSGIYLLGMIIFSTKQTVKRIRRREETQLLIAIMIAIIVATLLEIIFVKRFMLWSTTEVCVILYFTVLSRQQVKYDDLTGTYSRAVYSKRIESLNRKHNYIIAMIDIDGLKVINDTLGHACGDEAILRIAESIIKEFGRSMQLYRIGGDEFVLISEKNSEDTVRLLLENAVKNCGNVKNIPLSFSFGVASFMGSDKYENVISVADERLYEHKRKYREKC